MERKTETGWTGHHPHHIDRWVTASNYLSGHNSSMYYFKLFSPSAENENEVLCVKSRVYLIYRASKAEAPKKMKKVPLQSRWHTYFISCLTNQFGPFTHTLTFSLLPFLPAIVNSLIIAFIVSLSLFLFFVRRRRLPTLLLVAIFCSTFTSSESKRRTAVNSQHSTQFKMDIIDASERKAGNSQRELQLARAAARLDIIDWTEIQKEKTDQLNYHQHTDHLKLFYFVSTKLWTQRMAKVVPHSRIICSELCHQHSDLYSHRPLTS